VSRERTDWTLILPSAASYEIAAPHAEKCAAAQPELLALIVYVFVNY
jgi:hypothetical protein